MEDKRFTFPRASANLEAHIGPLFCRIFACRFESGGKLRQVVPGGLSCDLEDRVPPAEAGFRAGAFFQHGENVGGRISDDAEPVREAGNFDGRWSDPWGGFKNEAQIIGGGEFESPAKIDRIGPDGAVRPVHDLPFRFGHEAFGGDFRGDPGKGVLVNAPACFLFSLGQRDGSEDGAKDGPCGENFVGGEEKILGQDDAIVFDLEGKGEAEGGLHLRIPLCGMALSQKSQQQEKEGRSFRQHGAVMVLS